MNIRRRIETLEGRAENSAGGSDERGYRLVMLLCKAIENHQREQQGLAPIPLTPEEEEWERESDLEFLQDGLPRMRASPGWQSAEAQACLDEWEHDIKQKYLEERK